MKARFVYVVGDRTAILEKSGFDILDQLTFRNFKSREDIFLCPRYASMLKNLPVDGEFYISVPLEELSEENMRFLCIFGNDPFSNEQLFEIKYGTEENRSFVFSPRRNILRRVAANVDTFNEFYDKTKELYTSQEIFFHDVGMIYEDNNLATEGVRRLLSESLSGRDNYLMCRIIDRGISEFDSIKKLSDTDSNSSQK